MLAIVLAVGCSNPSGGPSDSGSPDGGPSVGAPGDPVGRMPSATRGFAAWPEWGTAATSFARRAIRCARPTAAMTKGSASTRQPARFAVRPPAGASCRRSPSQSAMGSAAARQPSSRPVPSTSAAMMPGRPASRSAARVPIASRDLAATAGSAWSRNQLAPGAENDDCTSGICGALGFGHCCTAQCATQGFCGAQDCDPYTGQCEYSGGLCSEPTCDAGLRVSTACDGQGACGPPQVTNCAPFACTPGGCMGYCNGNADCIGETIATYPARPAAGSHAAPRCSWTP